MTGYLSPLRHFVHMLLERSVLLWQHIKRGIACKNTITVHEIRLMYLYVVLCVHIQARGQCHHCNRNNIFHSFIVLKCSVMFSAAKIILFPINSKFCFIHHKSKKSQHPRKSFNAVSTQIILSFFRSSSKITKYAKPPNFCSNIYITLT